MVLINPKNLLGARIETDRTVGTEVAIELARFNDRGRRGIAIFYVDPLRFLDMQKLDIVAYSSRVEIHSQNSHRGRVRNREWLTPGIGSSTTFNFLGRTRDIGGRGKPDHASFDYGGGMTYPWQRGSPDNVFCFAPLQRQLCGCRMPLGRRSSKLRPFSRIAWLQRQTQENCCKSIAAEKNKTPGPFCTIGKIPLLLLQTPAEVVS